MKLDTLLHGLFDYAGMFPPAELEFDDALRTTARFHETLARPDLVGNDMVLTSKQLPALDAEVLERTGWSPERPFRICLVGVPAAHAGRNAEGVRRFNEDHAQGPFPQRVTSLEVTTDAADTASLTALSGPLDRARVLLGKETRLYLEPRWERAQWDEHGQALFALLDALASSGTPVGLKLRCAGPLALPRETLARIVPAVAAAGLPFKATQGLHHPIVEGERLGNEHGFVNLAVALRLRGALGETFPDAAILACLAEEEPTAFTFDDRLGWRDHLAQAAALEAAMERVPFAIGSCDLHEPDQDLLRLFPAASITTER